MSFGDRTVGGRPGGRLGSFAVALAVTGLLGGFPSVALAATPPPGPAGPGGQQQAPAGVAVPPIPAVAPSVTAGQDPAKLLARAMALLTAGAQAAPLETSLSGLRAQLNGDLVTAHQARAAAAAATAKAARADRLARQRRADATSLNAALRQATLDLYMTGGAPPVTRPVGPNVSGDAVIDAMVGEQVALSPRGILAARQRAAATAGQAAATARTEEATAQAAAGRSGLALGASAQQVATMQDELSSLNSKTAATLGTEATTVAQQAGRDLASATPLQFVPAAPLPAPVATTPVALAWAFSELGKSYVWGGTGPDVFDCSGLTQYAWNAAGVSIPRIAVDQYSYTVPVPLSDLRPGDLVFFGTDVHHVGMYIGGGLMINAPHTGAVVSITSMWWSDLLGFGRVHSGTTPVPVHAPTGIAAVAGDLGGVPSQVQPPPGAAPITETSPTTTRWTTTKPTTTVPTTTKPSSTTTVAKATPGSAAG